jgi:hypothetical protein
MRTYVTIPLLLLICSHANSEDLLKSRNWESSDGGKLIAELVSWDGKSVKLKRAKDGKKFDIAADKLSEGDQTLLKEESDKLTAIVEKLASGASSGSIPEPVEDTWGLACRLGKNELLWDSVPKTSRSSSEIISIMPLRFVSESTSSCFVIGKHVAFRILSPKGTNLTAGPTGVVLVIGGIDTDGKNTKITVAEKGTSFSPSSAKGEVVSCAMGEIGISKYLIFTYSLSSPSTSRTR